MTDGAMLAEILEALEIPCDKCSFHGKLDALAAGLGIDTEGRLLGDVLDDIAAKEGIQRVTACTVRLSASCTITLPTART